MTIVFIIQAPHGRTDMPRRVARFFLVHDPKTGKNCTQSTENVPNGHKISQMHFQMDIKYINIFQSKALKS
jgi:hypothetical protein